MDFDFENFDFFDFFGSQISGLGPAWAQLGPGLGPAWARLGPLGWAGGPLGWAPRVGPRVGPRVAPRVVIPSWRYSNGISNFYCFGYS